MARKPLPLGHWGKFRTYPYHTNEKGKVDTYRSLTNFRDFDGRTRQVGAYGSTKTAAENNLLEKVTERRDAGGGSKLTGADKFAKAADLWLRKFRQMVKDEKRSPGSLDTYRRHLDRTVLPALGDVRLGEMTTPLIDKVVGAIRDEVGQSTARSCRSIISGVLGLAVRYGAIRTNPVRDVERIEGQAKRRPRALTEAERNGWFALIRSDDQAVRAELPDLTTFMLATGVRIGESLGLLWSQVDLDTGEIEITHQIIRVSSDGLIRIRTKSRAGERVLLAPSWCLSMLRTRAAAGMRLDQPVFADTRGGFRDPSNVSRDLRKARAPIGGKARQELSAALKKARREADLTQPEVTRRLKWKGSRISLIERARLKVSQADAVSLLDLYKVRGQARTELLRLAADAVDGGEADAFSWLTSHVFRKTTATMLDDAGQSARQIADQLGHARPSMTQDVYMGRKAKNPGAATALEGAFSDD
ncbi:phage integrase central domain-containing protein [Kribbella solani]|uniref:phage integrase central domain-containing protein n=1 Tax=Kribbella solani TaxID=236067 RepID=UPI0029A2B051|nr:helix-turn-helix domain-containing protein [Kribbella solani]MDX2974266.1 helix-turn-helix domain-containing protein [Kribbella solani]